jgi:hypothetical protein
MLRHSRAVTIQSCLRRLVKDLGELFHATSILIDCIANHVNRVRGYQFRSEGPGEAKKNAAPFTVYENSGVETPLAPEANEDAVELEGKGFAEKQ